MSITTSKHDSAPATQTRADAAFTRPAEASWEDGGGFASETSEQNASPFRAEPSQTWAPAIAPLVLLAHADEVRRSGLAWELGTQGCTVVEVEDGLEILDYLDDQGPWLPLPRPDVVVAELDMPGCGGLEAARRMRESGDDTPIVFINVECSPAAAAAASRLERCRIVDGDIEGGVLRAAVEEALRARAG